MPKLRYPGLELQKFSDISGRARAFQSSCGWGHVVRASRGNIGSDDAGVDTEFRCYHNHKYTKPRDVSKIVSGLCR